MQTPAKIPDAARIDAALEVVRAHFPPSPLASHGDQFEKLEFALPTGAFKVRGALAAMHAARQRGVDEVLAASAGNHGAGVAWAAKALGMRATIVVPRDCPTIKREKMAKGATVHVAETAGYDETEGLARRMAGERGVPFLSPFDDTDVMAGNGGTLGRELQAQRPDVATVVVPVGGAGLLAGLIAAWQGHPIAPRFVAVQSEVSCAFARSLADGTVHSTWPPASSLAEGLEGGTGAAGVRLALEHDVTAITVPEAAIARAMRRLRARHGRPIEGSAAVVDAADALGLLSHLPGPRVSILTGGNVAVDHPAFAAPPAPAAPTEADAP